MRLALAVLLTSSFLVFASPAMALATGQCLPAAQVRAALTKEGQKPIIVGNQSGYGRPYALIFTANAEGERGYALRSDKPYGEQATTICVESAYTQIHLHDVKAEPIPEWAEIGNDPREAAAICRRYKLGYQENCNSHDESLRNLAGNGQRVIFMATGTAINPRDKSIRTDQRIWLTYSGEHTGGLFKATTVEGASYVLSGHTDTSFTQHGRVFFTR